ncbi:MAG: AMP-binding protein, partial [Sphingopyxis sp.]
MRKEWLARLDQARIDAHVAAGTWHNVVMSDVVRSLADRAVSPLAAIDGDHQLSYRDIWSDAVRLASALGARGLRPGDVVSFQLPNWHEVMVINVAACMAGLVCNPIVPIYRDSEVEF